MSISAIGDLLTRLDRWVLEEVPTDPEPRGHAHAITARVVRRQGRWKPRPEDLEEVVQILRGLEVFGFVQQTGEWWRRVPGR